MKRNRERGYNLIELLVAIALLGVVMLAILSLFIWGRKNVYSGKQMTTAISIGTKVMEDLAPLTKADIYNGVFAINDTAGGTTITFGNPAKTYKDAAIRSTKAGIITGYPALQTENTAGPQFLSTTWKDQLLDASGKPKLDDGAITLIMMPRADAAASPKFGTSAVMQMRVVVSWIENRRRREVILDSVKAQ